MLEERLWLLLCLALHGAGLLLFNEGFFLTRVELATKSACDTVPWIYPPIASASALECWLPYTPQYRRAVVIVVDALRFDFAEWQDIGARAGDGSSAHFFENKLGTLRYLLANRPQHSLLVPFVADPPTTTMQRLKGIFTGGLPTFMEVKDDVASEGMEITEDNFVDLLLHSGPTRRNLTFMGDDTWAVLFPTQFSRSFPFPSFNVKDLDTVDKGVMQHLLPELRRDDWDFLVAHFLGVDHCGHRYGPDNEHMARKLGEMNEAIDAVVRLLDSDAAFNDTLLIIIGDHGMTADGNHGGATREEVDAALFVYSPRPLRPAASLEDASLALRNVGLQNREAPRGKGQRSRPSVQQIDLAPTLALLLGLPIPFGNLGSVIPELFFSAQADGHGVSELELELERYERLNHAMNVNVGQVLRYLETYAARSGVVSVAELAGLRRRAVESFAPPPPSHSHTLQARIDAQRATFAAARSVLSDASALGRSLWTAFNLPFMAAGFALALAGLASVALLAPSPSSSPVPSPLSPSRTPASASAIAASPTVSPRSRFRLEPSSTCGDKPRTSGPWWDSAAATGCIGLQMLARLSNSYIVSEPRGSVFLLSSFGAAQLLLLFRSASVDDKGVASIAGARTTAFMDKATVRSQAAAVAVLVASGRASVELAPVQWWRGQESLPGDWERPWFWAVCLLPMIALLILRTRVPFASGGLAAAAAQWACTLAHWGTQALGVAVPWSHAHVLPRAVYGIAAVGTVSRLWAVRSEQTAVGGAPDGLWLWLWPYLLLVGPASPAAACLLCAQIWGARCMGATNFSTGVVLSVVASQGFFATGHESSFNKLHYASPFVGFDEYEYFRGVAMLGLNTFGPFVAAAWLAAGAQERRALLLALSAKAATMVAFVALERRHLMVWAIFAPKYVFDGVALLVTNGALLVFCLRGATTS